MKFTTKHWLHGLAAAFIGGGSSAVSAGFSAVMMDPTKFNLSTGMLDTLKMMLVTFFISGAITAFAYLKQSPIPPEDENSSTGSK